MICYEEYNSDELVACGSGTACPWEICHPCLIQSFTRPLMMINGMVTERDPAQCPHCQAEGAFSLDEDDAAAVNQEIGEMYCFEVASVGASYASTSHEQGDSPWELSDEEENEDDD